MKRRIIIILAALACSAAIPAVAAASVKTNLAHTVNLVEANGGAKSVTINGNPTAASGTFTASMCSSTVNVAGTSYFYFQPFNWVFTISRYSNNGNTVHMGNVVETGTC